jgi:predicted nucleic acid-binding protein
MDKLFLDTNVLLDYLAARTPFDKDAKILIERADQGQVEVFISALSVCNIAYILRKLMPDTEILPLITDITRLVTITPINEVVIAEALASSFSDFEDAIQYFSAVRYGGITHIITRNAADYVHSIIPVITPAEYLIP